MQLLRAFFTLFFLGLLLFSPIVEEEVGLGPQNVMPHDLSSDGPFIFDPNADGALENTAKASATSYEEPVYWESQTSGTEHDLISVDFVNANIGWVVGGSGTTGIILKTTDGGQNWSSLIEGDTVWLSVDFVDANNGWVGGELGHMLKTTNGGQNWIPQTSGTSNHVRSICCLNGSSCWAAGTGGTILKTTNGGTDWISQTTGTSEELRSIHFIDNSTGWAVGFDGTILKTTNGGTNWVSQNSGLATPLFSVDFADANNGWAVGALGTILSTTNGGSDWGCKVIDLSILYLNSIDFVNVDAGWVVGYSGTIFKTTNGGTDWTSDSSGTGAWLHSVCFLDNNTGWAVGNGGIILRYKTSDFVEGDYDQNIRRIFFLRQNYPNPFNATTIIPFFIGLKKHGDETVQHTSLTIYNIMGQKVRTLVDADKVSGYYEAVWNGKDNRGCSVSSGIYYYQLNIGEYTQSKKMLFVK